MEPTSYTSPNHLHVWKGGVSNTYHVWQETRIFISLFMASFIIATLPVNEEDSKVHRVKVGDGRVKASRQAPRKRHQEVTPGASISTCERNRDGAYI